MYNRPIGLALVCFALSALFLFISRGNAEGAGVYRSVNVRPDTVYYGTTLRTSKVRVVSDDTTYYIGPEVLGGQYEPAAVVAGLQRADSVRVWVDHDARAIGMFARGVEGGDVRILPSVGAAWQRGNARGGLGLALAFGVFGVVALFLCRTDPEDAPET